MPHDNLERVELNYHNEYDPPSAIEEALAEVKWPRLQQLMLQQWVDV